MLPQNKSVNIQNSLAFILLVLLPFVHFVPQVLRRDEYGFGVHQFQFCLSNLNSDSNIYWKE